jgi:actin-related protein
LPIYEGYALPHAARIGDYAGLDVTLKFSSKLRRAGLFDARSCMDFEALEACKEDLFRDTDGQALDSALPTFTLPDGTTVSVPAGMLESCYDPLFKVSESRATDAEHSLVNMLTTSVAAVDEDIREDLARSIVANGGTARFPGFRNSLDSALGDPDCPLSAYAPQTVFSGEMPIGSWIGASILGSLSTFSSMWVSATMYEEVGPTIIRRRCF